MLKHVLFILLFAGLGFGNAKAQLVNDLHTLYHPAYFNNFFTDSSAVYGQNGILKSSKTDYSVSFGSGYTSFGKGIGFSSSYISPAFAYSPNERLQLVVGATFAYNSYNRMPYLSNSISSNNSQAAGNPTSAYAFGKYQLTSKLSVFAMGSFSKNQIYTSPYSSGIGKMDYNEFGVGFNYKLGEKASIGASFNIINSSGFGASPFNSYNRFPY